ncbi:unnamed protein product [Amoebophrya sp. A120]|nr:unnamed protein product [Amoebophrya sp. A120]|eukprot:GSA120T00021785001.1
MTSNGAFGMQTKVFNFDGFAMSRKGSNWGVELAAQIQQEMLNSSAETSSSGRYAPRYLFLVRNEKVRRPLLDGEGGGGSSTIGAVSLSTSGAAVHDKKDFVLDPAITNHELVANWQEADTTGILKQRRQLLQNEEIRLKRLSAAFGSEMYGMNNRSRFSVSSHGNRMKNGGDHVENVDGQISSTGVYPNSGSDGVTNHFPDPSHDFSGSSSATGSFSENWGQDTECEDHDGEENHNGTSDPSRQTEQQKKTKVESQMQRLLSNSASKKRTKDDNSTEEPSIFQIDAKKVYVARSPTNRKQSDPNSILKSKLKQYKPPPTPSHAEKKKLELKKRNELINEWTQNVTKQLHEAVKDANGELFAPDEAEDLFYQLNYGAGSMDGDENGHYPGGRTDFQMSKEYVDGAAATAAGKIPRDLDFQQHKANSQQALKATTALLNSTEWSPYASDFCVFLTNSVKVALQPILDDFYDSELCQKIEEFCGDSSTTASTSRASAGSDSTSLSSTRGGTTGRPGSTKATNASKRYLGGAELIICETFSLHESDLPDVADPFYNHSTSNSSSTGATSSQTNPGPRRDNPHRPSALFSRHHYLFPAMNEEQLFVSKFGLLKKPRNSNVNLKESQNEKFHMESLLRANSGHATQAQNAFVLMNKDSSSGMFFDEEMKHGGANQKSPSWKAGSTSTSIRSPTSSPARRRAGAGFFQPMTSPFGDVVAENKDKVTTSEKNQKQDETENLSLSASPTNSPANRRKQAMAVEWAAKTLNTFTLDADQHRRGAASSSGSSMLTARKHLFSAFGDSKPLAEFLESPGYDSVSGRYRSLDTDGRQKIWRIRDPSRCTPAFLVEVEFVYNEIEKKVECNLGKFVNEADNLNCTSKRSSDIDASGASRTSTSSTRLRREIPHAASDVEYDEENKAQLRPGSTSFVSVPVGSSSSDFVIREIEKRWRGIDYDEFGGSTDTTLPSSPTKTSSSSRPQSAANRPRSAAKKRPRSANRSNLMNGDGSCKVATSSAAGVQLRSSTNKAVTTLLSSKTTDSALILRDFGPFWSCLREFAYLATSPTMCWRNTSTSRTASTASEYKSQKKEILETTIHDLQEQLRKLVIRPLMSEHNSSTSAGAASYADEVGGTASGAMMALSGGQSREDGFPFMTHGVDDELSAKSTAPELLLASRLKNAGKRTTDFSFSGGVPGHLELDMFVPRSYASASFLATRSVISSAADLLSLDSMIQRNRTDEEENEDEINKGKNRASTSPSRNKNRTKRDLLERAVVREHQRIQLLHQQIKTPVIASIEYLNLWGCNLRKLAPDCLRNFKNLKCLILAWNKFEKLDDLCQVVDHAGAQPVHISSRVNGGASSPSSLVTSSSNKGIVVPTSGQTEQNTAAIASGDGKELVTGKMTNTNFPGVAHHRERTLFIDLSYNHLRLFDESPCHLASGGEEGPQESSTFAHLFPQCTELDLSGNPLLTTVDVLGYVLARAPSPSSVTSSAGTSAQLFPSSLKALQIDEPLGEEGRELLSSSGGGEIAASIASSSSGTGTATTTHFLAHLLRGATKMCPDLQIVNGGEALLCQQDDDADGDHQCASVVDADSFFRLQLAASGLLPRHYPSTTVAAGRGAQGKDSRSTNGMLGNNNPSTSPLSPPTRRPQLSPLKEDSASGNIPVKSILSTTGGSPARRRRMMSPEKVASSTALAGAAGGATGTNGYLQVQTWAEDDDEEEDHAPVHRDALTKTLNLSDLLLPAGNSTGAGPGLAGKTADDGVLGPALWAAAQGASSTVGCSSASIAPARSNRTSSNSRNYNKTSKIMTSNVSVDILQKAGLQKDILPLRSSDDEEDDAMLADEDAGLRDWLKKWIAKTGNITAASQAPQHYPTNSRYVFHNLTHLIATGLNLTSIEHQLLPLFAAASDSCTSRAGGGTCSAPGGSGLPASSCSTSTFSCCRRLETLNVSKNQLQSLSGIQHFTGLKRLDASMNSLTSSSGELHWITRCCSENLEILCLSGNGISDLNWMKTSSTCGSSTSSSCHVAASTVPPVTTSTPYQLQLPMQKLLGLYLGDNALHDFRDLYLLSLNFPRLAIVELRGNPLCNCSVVGRGSTNGGIMQHQLFQGARTVEELVQWDESGRARRGGKVSPPGKTKSALQNDDEEVEDFEQTKEQSTKPAHHLWTPIEAKSASIVDKGDEAALLQAVAAASPEVGQADRDLVPNSLEHLGSEDEEESEDGLLYEDEAPEPQDDEQDAGGDQEAALRVDEDGNPIARADQLQEGTTGEQQDAGRQGENNYVDYQDENSDNDDSTATCFIEDDCDVTNKNSSAARQQRKEERRKRIEKEKNEKILEIKTRKATEKPIRRCDIVSKIGREYEYGSSRLMFATSKRTRPKLHSGAGTSTGKDSGAVDGGEMDGGAPDDQWCADEESNEASSKASNYAITQQNLFTHFHFDYRLYAIFLLHQNLQYLDGLPISDDEVRQAWKFFKGTLTPDLLASSVLGFSTASSSAHNSGNVGTSSATTTSAAPPPLTGFISEQNSVSLAFQNLVSLDLTSSKLWNLNHGILSDGFFPELKILQLDNNYIQTGVIGPLSKLKTLKMNRIGLLDLARWKMVVETSISGHQQASSSAGVAHQIHSETGGAYNYHQQSTTTPFSSNGTASNLKHIQVYRLPKLQHLELSYNGLRTLTPLLQLTNRSRSSGFSSSTSNSTTSKQHPFPQLRVLVLANNLLTALAPSRWNHAAPREEKTVTSSNWNTSGKLGGGALSSSENNKILTNNRAPFRHLTELRALVLNRNRIRFTDRWSFFIGSNCNVAGSSNLHKKQSKLTEIHMAHNRVTSLDCFALVPNLTVLRLDFNRVTALETIGTMVLEKEDDGEMNNSTSSADNSVSISDHIIGTRSNTSLNNPTTNHKRSKVEKISLARNPIARKPFYRFTLCQKLGNRLKEIDNRKCTQEDRVGYSLKQDSMIRKAQIAYNQQQQAANRSSLMQANSNVNSASDNNYEGADPAPEHNSDLPVGANIGAGAMSTTTLTSMPANHKNASTIPTSKFTRGLSSGVATLIEHLRQETMQKKVDSETVVEGEDYLQVGQSAASFKGPGGGPGTASTGSAPAGAVLAGAASPDRPAGSGDNITASGATKQQMSSTPQRIKKLYPTTGNTPGSSGSKMPAGAALQRSTRKIR